MAKKQKRKFVPRKQYKFWLNTNLEAERRLVEFIAYLKSSRKFAKTMRDGIRLIWSLGEGDTSVLFELFPSLERQFISRYAPPAPDTDKLEREIAELKALILKQGRITNDAPMVAAPPLKPSLTAGAGSTLGQGRKMSLPLIDDDDRDTLVINKSTGKGNGENMLNSFAKLGLF